MTQQTKITGAAKKVKEWCEAEGQNLLAHEGDFYMYRKGAWEILRGDTAKEKLEPILMEACEEWGSEYAKAHKAHWRTLQTLTSVRNVKLDGAPLVACKNGTLHFDERELYEWEPKDYITRRLQFDFDKKAKCPKWLSTLRRMFKDSTRDDAEVEQCLRFIQQWMGVNIVGPAAKDTRYLKQALFFLGPPGSGKSSVADVFRALMGSNNISATPLHKVNDTFGLEDLVGRVAWIADDVSDESKTLDPNQFKVLITGEPFSVNRKYRTPITTTFQGAVLMTGNTMPRIPDNSGAAFDRISVVNLRNKFTSDDLKRDLEGSPNLLAYLHKHNEFPGIINWALDGFEDAFDARKFAKPKTIVKYVDALRRENNPIFDFLSDGIVEDERYGIHADAAAALAIEFARERHGEKLAFKKASSQLVAVIEETRPKIRLEYDESGTKVTHFLGAKIHSDVLPFWMAAKDKTMSTLKNLDKPHFKR